MLGVVYHISIRLTSYHKMNLKVVSKNVVSSFMDHSNKFLKILEAFIYLFYSLLLTILQNMSWINFTNLSVNFNGIWSCWTRCSSSSWLNSSIPVTEATWCFPIHRDKKHESTSIQNYARHKPFQERGIKQKIWC